jgi:ubiquinone biosynthesis protein UbiJ
MMFVEERHTQMTITEAKAVADNPSGFTPEEWKAAHERLEKTKSNGGVRNSERATARLERRLGYLGDYIAAVQ